MKLTFRLEPYLFKYYSKKWNVETSLKRKSIPGMLALAHIKDYMNMKNERVDHLTESVFFQVPNKKAIRLRVKEPDTNSILGFNWNIRSLFYDEMHLQVSIAMANKQNAVLLEEIRAWMAKYDLSEDDVSEQTLRREYHRALKRCEARAVA